VRALRQQARERPGTRAELHDHPRTGEVDRVGDLTGKRLAAGKGCPHTPRIGQKRAQETQTQATPPVEERAARYAREGTDTSDT
jgi:hypothetical protein